MKNIIWIIIAAVIAIGGYMLYSGKSATEMATDVSEAVDAPAALENASEVAGDAVDAAQGVVGDAVDATAEAVTDAGEAVTDAAEGAVEAVTDTATAATDAAEGAVDTVTDTATDAAEAASDAVAATTESATDAVEATTEAAEATTESATAATQEAATDATTEELLTVDGFNLDKVTAMIEESDLGALQKATLTKGLDAAKDNPEVLKTLLEKIRAAMNL